MAIGDRVIPCITRDSRVMKKTMLKMSVLPSRPATTGQRANRIGPAPLRPTQETNSLALGVIFLKGRRHRKTLAGRATIIIKAPMIMAGRAMPPNSEGLARRPSIRNISNCISQVIPLKKLRISFLYGSLALLPMTIAQTYRARRPFPYSMDARPLVRKPILSMRMEYNCLPGSLTLSRRTLEAKPMPTPTANPTASWSSRVQNPVHNIPKCATGPICFVESIWTRRIVSTYAIGSLLPDSSSSKGPRFCLRCFFLPLSTENTDAESVEDITAARRKQLRNDEPSTPM